MTRPGTGFMQKQIKDEYDIIEEIGSGGMATVFKAVQKSLDRLVAIKVLNKSFHGDPQIVRRFERESRVAASLQHENIVQIYDYWKKPNYAIMMEYVEGATLADVIEKTGALPVDVGVMVAIQAGTALDYAHMRGLVHRDIKPSNIMIKRNGEVKLMDFGIAQGRNHESLTSAGTLIGTPAYMSPEHILGQQPDVRSDIFSFGIVLYELFTGTKPFKEDDNRTVTAKIVKDTFLPPRRINKEIPLRLQWLIKKCLRKNPNRRYGSMLEVQKKLGRFVTGRTTKAGSLLRISNYLVSRNVFKAAAEQETLVVPALRSKPRRLNAAFVAFLLALAVVVGIAALYYRSLAVHEAGSPPVLIPSKLRIMSGTAPTIRTNPGGSTNLGTGATRTGGDAQSGRQPGISSTANPPSPEVRQ